MGYEVKFLYQNDTESFSDTNVFDVKFSPNSLTGSTYFRQIPQRVTFSAFGEDFYSNLIDDVGIYKNISNYTIQILYDDVQVFTGVIDLALVNYNAKSNIYSITSYDNLYLLKIYSNIELELTNDEGLGAYETLSQYTSEISAELGWSINSVTDFDFRNESIGTQLINTFDPQVFINSLKDDVPSFSHLPLDNNENAPWHELYKGRIRFLTSPEYALQPQLLIIGLMRSFAGLSEDYGNLNEGQLVYQYNVRAEIWQYYNGCGWQEREDLREVWEYPYNDSLGMFSQPQQVSLLKYNSIIDNYDANSVAYIASSGDGNLQWWLVPDYSIYPYTYSIGGEINLSTNLRVPSLIPDYTVEEDSTEKIYNAFNFMNASLLYFDASLFCDQNGVIRLINKYPDIGSPITIAREDIIDYNISRIMKYDSELNELNALKGNQEANRRIHKEVNLETQSSIQQLDIVIEDSYTLDINSTIADPISGNDFVIINIDRDRKTLNYIIKAWRT